MTSKSGPKGSADEGLQRTGRRALRGTQDSRRLYPGHTTPCPGVGGTPSPTRRPTGGRRVPGLSLDVRQSLLRDFLRQRSHRLVSRQCSRGFRFHRVGLRTDVGPWVSEHTLYLVGPGSSAHDPRRGSGTY